MLPLHRDRVSSPSDDHIFLYVFYIFTCQRPRSRRDNVCGCGTTWGMEQTSTSDVARGLATTIKERARNGQGTGEGG
ncbi:unnamed protein product [Caenorhabditis nigoni]